MERVAFLIERSGNRVSALLNPERLEQRRIAGLATRAGAGGAIIGHGRADDPIIATGGGTTEIELELLFDSDLRREERANAGDTTAQALIPEDVREMTKPLWDMAENALDAVGHGKLPVVRFVWGKAWNVPGVVVEVAERLERFTAEGVPRRSWMTLLLRRIDETSIEAGAPATAPATPSFETAPPAANDPSAPSIDLLLEPDGGASARFDLIAAERYGDPGLWRYIALVNGIEDPLAPLESPRLLLPGLPGSDRGSA